MMLVARILRGMFGRGASEPASASPEVMDAVAASTIKTRTTHQLLLELRSRTEQARLNRARLFYEDGLNDGRGD